MKTVIIGGQYGDECKAEIVNFIKDEYDIFVRFNGGSNAGNTVTTDNNEKIVFRLLPSGGLKAGSTLVLTEGMCINLDVLMKEIRELKQKNPNFEVLVSKTAPVILSKHMVEDSEKNISKFGSVGTGVGPCNVDRMMRKSEMMGSISVNGISTIDTADYLNNSLDKNILFIGAHGFGLDIHQGEYPIVTTSNCGFSSIGSQAGFSPSLVDERIMCIKPYVTKVGPGDFDGMGFESANYIREKGNEIGSVSGRKRRIGWLNLRNLCRAIMIERPSYLALSKIDVLCDIEMNIGVYDKSGSLMFFKPWSSSEYFDYLDMVENGIPHLETEDQYKDNKFWQFLSFIESSIPYGTKVKLFGHGCGNSNKFDARKLR